jgi:biotin operon repressor
MGTNSDPTTLEQFWRRVALHRADQCWRWVGALDSKGYGRFSANGRAILAHRFSYIAEHGPIPAGLLVRHQCDNPRCVNPRHLLPGTPKDNTRDMVERGRQRKPAPFPTPHQIDVLDQIKALFVKQGCSPSFAEIGRAIGISTAGVSVIVQRLERHGLIERSPRRWRSIRIVQPHEATP